MAPAVPVAVSRIAPCVPPEPNSFATRVDPANRMVYASATSAMAEAHAPALRSWCSSPARALLIRRLTVLTETESMAAISRLVWPSRYARVRTCRSSSRRAARPACNVCHCKAVASPRQARWTTSKDRPSSVSSCRACPWPPWRRRGSVTDLEAPLDVSTPDLKSPPRYSLSGGGQGRTTRSRGPAPGLRIEPEEPPSAMRPKRRPVCHPESAFDPG